MFTSHEASLILSLPRGRIVQPIYHLWWFGAWFLIGLSTFGFSHVGIVCYMYVYNDNLWGMLFTYIHISTYIYIWWHDYNYMLTEYCRYNASICIIFLACCIYLWNVCRYDGIVLYYNVYIYICHGLYVTIMNNFRRGINSWNYIYICVRVWWRFIECDLYNG